MELQERVLPLMTVTESAAAKIKQLIAEEEDVSVLRVAIQGGGCSGFQYGLGFDRGAADGDLEFEMHGVQVVVDPFSAPYLKGAEIDYVDSIQSATLSRSKKAPRPKAPSAAAARAVARSESCAFAPICRYAASRETCAGEGHALLETGLGRLA
jgi:iron-sulfur cluster assembly accessory protein